MIMNYTLIYRFHYTKRIAPDRHGLGGLLHKTLHNINKFPGRKKVDGLLKDSYNEIQFSLKGLRFLRAKLYKGEKK